MVSLGGWIAVLVVWFARFCEHDLSWRLWWALSHYFRGHVGSVLYLPKVEGNRSY